jgi:FkbM family methyltransferase
MQKTFDKFKYIVKNLIDVGLNYRKISFSQTGEDLIVQFILRDIGIQKPSYIDIGAHHPFFLSNTALFYRNGSRGINIEPNITQFELFQKHRKDDVNLNIGIGKESGTLTFYINKYPELSTFSSIEAQKYHEMDYPTVEERQVRVETLDSIINTYCGGQYPDFMTLDAEGIDEIVLQAINYEKSSPKVICVESVSNSNNGTGVKNHELIEFLQSKGYIVFADTYINTIFVLKKLWVRG